MLTPISGSYTFFSPSRTSSFVNGATAITPHPRFLPIIVPISSAAHRDRQTVQALRSRARSRLPVSPGPVPFSAKRIEFVVDVVDRGRPSLGGRERHVLDVGGPAARRPARELARPGHHGHRALSCP